MKIALVHDWLTGMRGGERVLEALCEIYPEADIYTILHCPGRVSPAIEKHNIFTSFIQGLPAAKNKYRHYLPLMPMAIERFDLSSYQLIVSSSHCVAKGVRVSKDSLHICYCSTPMRYIWDMRDAYLSSGSYNLLIGSSMRLFVPFLRRWDVSAADRVNYFIANSQNVQRKIEKYYKRQSTVIYPPADIERFSWQEPSRGFYLIVSAFAPYKRVDLAIKAFNELRLPLKIIGAGEDEKRLKKMASSNIEFLGWQSDNVVAEYLSQCKALIFPGEEDSGIVPIEAMASGKPVIAYAKGGALETVVDRVTGIFFYEQNSQALSEAVIGFEKGSHSFMPWRIRQHVAQFDKKIFKVKIEQFINNILLSNVKKT